MLMKPARVLIVMIFSVALQVPSWASASELVKTHPEAVSKIRGIHNVVLLPIRISMFEIGAGETPEKMEDWGTTAQANVVQSLEAQTAKGDLFKLTRLAEGSLEGPARENYDETRALYDAVEGSIVFHTYDERRPWYFAGKAGWFVYTLGSEVQGLSPGADAFMLIQGVDRRSSGGRQALQIGTMVIGAALGVIPIPRGGGSIHTVALVEAKSGTILWFYRTTYVGDLREAQSASLFVEDVLKELTVLWGK